MKISIASDHAGFNLKQILKSYINEKGHEVLDLGPMTDDRVDYPDYAKKVCVSVQNKESERGILVCGSGVGMAIAANKFRGIRAVVCTEPLSAKASRAHNDTNVLTFGERIISSEVAKEIVDVWLTQAFEGGRHAARIEKFDNISDIQ